VFDCGFNRALTSTSATSHCCGGRFANQAVELLIGTSEKRRALRSLLFLMLPDKIARRTMSPSAPPILIEGRSESRETHHYIDTSNVVQVHRVSSRDKRSFCVLCLQLLLTV
jgi:hypothetical protein